MPRIINPAAIALLAALAIVALPGPSGQANTPTALLVPVEGPITPVVADHLADAVTEGETRGVPVIVRIDTPGGLDLAMRDIVQTFLNARTPVIAYVAPEGARAASAGTFITMSAHVAAMAPATSIGAATPVDMQGGEITDKIINDAVAFAVSVAERRDRDTEFAEAAVREGISVTARQAVEMGVVDLVANDLDELLAVVDGRTVSTAGGEITLVTADAVIERYEMSTTRRILARIADPNLAFLLLSIGVLAIVYEAANPGLGFAGVAGMIAVILGFFALSVLPVATAGVVLLILAIALFIGEVFAPGVGVLAAGGTISLILAGIFLFDGTVAVSAPVLWPTALVLGAGTTLAGRAAWRARMKPSTTGTSTLVGREVEVQISRSGRATTFTEGSWWSVRSGEGEIREGPARITAVEGVTLVVEPIGESHDD